MKVLYKTTFLKDLKRLKGAEVYDRIHRLAFVETLRWRTIDDAPGIKRLNAKIAAFRIRIGEYRIGFFLDGETVIFSRVLHRREIYRFFP